ncbi:ATP-dependent endonuclease [Thalassolituus sp.]|uniref:ATP-dependent nuclease n=1 Tax=Thalassolituus sp. TaxID=2030822 RepID=UPI00243A9315|nr:AAA family ATPase [Thalassolituus sp.]
MKLQTIRLSNFQSFGEHPTEISLESTTYLIGPNGSGKTALLQALCRLFAFDPSQRRVLRSDFHVPYGEESEVSERSLWIEADFTFPETLNAEANTTVPPLLSHMRLDAADGIPRVRFRLSATMGPDGDIEESLEYVLDVDEHNAPVSRTKVPRSERNNIHVHYLPARRDPADHISYGTNALIGRLLRSVRWDNERAQIKGFTDQISDCLSSNPSVDRLSSALESAWGVLHKGKFFTDPKITFVASEIEALLKHLSISFKPGHGESIVDFSRLSDGQKSMLYLSLVISAQSVGRKVLSQEDQSFDIEKLRPPVFTLMAIEEPENSLSPHYLGRVIDSLASLTNNDDGQALIATHAPSMLRRIAPESIRYMRLNEERQSRITCIQLPEDDGEAHKFVREAVQAFPEVYFSRLVVLGEGDSEEIVLPRLLKAQGVPVDAFGVAITPLGGRHVNHFWRLLAALKIPYVTLLDLDVARNAAGWGRIKVANDNFKKFSPDKAFPTDWTIPHWKKNESPVREHHFLGDEKQSIFTALENRGVFFSEPMDLDFSMLKAYPDAYGVERETPDDDLKNAVLGKSHHDSSQYTEDELELFSTYQKHFKLGSKPAAHLSGLSKLSDEQLIANMPASYVRLADAIKAKLEEWSE